MIEDIKRYLNHFQYHEICGNMLIDLSNSQLNSKMYSHRVVVENLHVAYLIFHGMVRKFIFNMNESVFMLDGYTYRICDHFIERFLERCPSMAQMSKDFLIMLAKELLFIHHDVKAKFPYEGEFNVNGRFNYINVRVYKKHVDLVTYFPGHFICKKYPLDQMFE